MFLRQMQPVDKIFNTNKLPIGLLIFISKSKTFTIEFHILTVETVNGEHVAFHLNGNSLLGNVRIIPFSK